MIALSLRTNVKMLATINAIVCWVLSRSIRQKKIGCTSAMLNNTDTEESSMCQHHQMNRRPMSMNMIHSFDLEMMIEDTIFMRYDRRFRSPHLHQEELCFVQPAKKN